MYTRPMVFTGGMPKLAMSGDGWLSMAKPYRVNTDSNQIIGVAGLASGVWSRGMANPRTDTTADGATIIAAFPNMGIGDGMWLLVSCPAAGTLTLAAGANSTVTGTLTVPAGGNRWFFVSRTSATNIDWSGV